jgi:hypothetical protein
VIKVQKVWWKRCSSPSPTLNPTSNCIHTSNVSAPSTNALICEGGVQGRCVYSTFDWYQIIQAISDSTTSAHCFPTGLQMVSRVFRITVAQPSKISLLLTNAACLMWMYLHSVAATVHMLTLADPGLAFTSLPNMLLVPSLGHMLPTGIELAHNGNTLWSFCWDTWEDGASWHSTRADNKQR